MAPTPPGQRSVRSKVSAWRAPAAARRRLRLAAQLALATAVLGQNMGHGAGLLADLVQRLAQIGINRMGHDGGEQRHEEHRDAAGGHEHGGGLLAHGLGGARPQW